MREILDSLRCEARECSPTAVVSRLTLNQGDLFVVRDDLLEGGTKQRAAGTYIEGLVRDGFHEFVYASPFAGFAQVALAVACRDVGVRAVIFAERDQAFVEPREHEFTKLAESFGARIVLCDSLAEAEGLAESFMRDRRGSLKVPLGFNTPDFKRILHERIAVQWKTILNNMPASPRSLWIPVGSGTLAQIFSDLIPESMRLHCVDVHVLPEEDKRIRAISRLKNAVYYSAPELFAQPCQKPPSIPSNKYYDSKLWRFISEYSQAGDLWWNVAR